MFPLLLKHFWLKRVATSDLLCHLQLVQLQLFLGLPQQSALLTCPLLCLEHHCQWQVVVDRLFNWNSVCYFSEQLFHYRALWVLVDCLCVCCRRRCSINIIEDESSVTETVCNCSRDHFIPCCCCHCYCIQNSQFEMGFVVIVSFNSCDESFQNAFPIACF